MGGDPLAYAIVLWTRYVGSGTLELRYALYTDGAWSDALPIVITPEDGGFVHHDLTGLPADTPVAFQFVDDGGAASALATTRTSPAPGVQGTLRVVATSCSKYQGEGTFPVMPLALARGPADCIIWVGDTVYTYDTTLEQYRARWALNYATPEFQQLLSTGAHIFTLDDHEVTNNFEGATVDPEQLANASQAFYEHTPRRGDSQTPPRIYRSNRFGDIVEIFVLDCRGERDFEAGQYISPEQMSWLLEGLSASPCRWKCIVNSVPIANMPALFDVAKRDRWEGYPEQRAALVEAVGSIPGVVFLSGDFHMPGVARVEPEGPAQFVWDILCGATGSDGNPLGAIMKLQGEVFDHQFPWVETPHTATLIEFDSAGFMTVTFIGEDDLDYFVGTFNDAGVLVGMSITEVPR